jgi:SAM-dependent methyltransferase
MSEIFKKREVETMNSESSESKPIVRFYEKTPSESNYPCEVCSGKEKNSLFLKCVNKDSGLFCDLYKCGNCESLFYYPKTSCNYEALTEEWKIKYYIELGAGIASIIQPIVKARKNFTTAINFLDIGCGFGYGVDFAANQLNWDSVGIEPSIYGKIGAGSLNLNIKNTYSHTAELNKFDYNIVFASEVIEHIKDPSGFIDHLKSFLKPDGILIITTPDSSLIGTLNDLEEMGLLLPSEHLFLLSKNALYTILLQAGFKEIVIERWGYSLVAYASYKNITLDDSCTSFNDLYLEYLYNRINSITAPSSVWIGFACRLFKELVNLNFLPKAELISHKLKLYRLEAGRFSPPGGSLCN